MKRLLLVTIALWLAAPPVFAQGTADVAAALGADPVYVAPGAEAADPGDLRASVAAAAGLDLDLRVAVLASGEAEPLAQDLLGELPGTTVAVFTPGSYGVASDEVAQGRLDDALAAAADDLAGPDAAAGLASLVDALDDSGGVPLWLLVLAGLAVLLAVGIAGRIWDARTRARRQAAKRDRRRTELRERARGLGERVVTLSDRIELAESPAASRAYAEAAAVFDAAERRIAEAGTMHDLDAVEADLERAGRLLDEAAAATRA